MACAVGRIKRDAAAFQLVQNSRIPAFHRELSLELQSNEVAFGKTSIGAGPAYLQTDTGHAFGVAGGRAHLGRLYGARRRLLPLLVEFNESTPASGCVRI